MNVKDAKPERKVDCWNCGGNHFARDCKKPAKKEGDKKGKVNDTFRDYDDEDYDVGVILTCFENQLPEYFQNDEDSNIPDAEFENDSLPYLESVSSDDDMPELLEHDQISDYLVQQITFSNNFDEIRISDLNGAFTNSIILYNFVHYNLFTDNKNVITNGMDDNDKIRMVFHRDYHRKKLYLNLRKQELMAGA